MIIIINNYNNKNLSTSVIQNYIKAFDKTNINYKIVSNIDKTLDLSEITGIIMTGSSLRLTKKTSSKNYIHNLYYLYNTKVPVLGICFGCQILHLLYGGKLENTGDKYYCRDQKVELSNHKLFNNVINTNNIHFCFTDLPLGNKKIKELSWFDFKQIKNIPCGFEYNHNVFGLLFHPEKFKDTYQILYNFCNLCIK